MITENETIWSVGFSETLGFNMIVAVVDDADMFVIFLQTMYINSGHSQ